MSISFANNEDAFERKRKIREISLRNKTIVNSLKPVNKSEKSRKDQIDDILNAIETNVLSCDLLISFFYSSLFNYRKSTICYPFPESFYKPENGEKDFEDVEILCKGLPSIYHLKEHPSELNNLPKQALDLLYWILFPLDKVITVEMISLEKFFSLTSINNLRNDMRPNYVFQISYNNELERYNLFKRYKEEYGSFIAYHGSSLENFHSIVRAGLDETFCKQHTLYGDGIYFSKSLDVAYSFKNNMMNKFEDSKIGQNLGVIAVCEVVKHPDFLKIGSSKAAISLSDKEIPEGYILAVNGSIVNVKYLLVYEHRKQVMKKRKGSFVYLFFIVYILLLVIIWICKPKNMNKLYKMFL